MASFACPVMPDLLSSNDIRSAFLDFFQDRGHEVVPSDSLAPRGDPTLLFTNAGMNQFKNVFLGTGERDYRRATDTQKCLRVSGKHNDLEEVGLDTYHHTFFEMLGNWSFGDYFKKEAIGWAWELLVDVFGLTPDRLYATVHEGDEALGLSPDSEAADLWKSETGIDPDHILYGNSKDNFWMMGDEGPCGPCSEIHIDLRSDEARRAVSGKELVNTDHPEVIELWNLVFIQYNALRDGSLEPLAARHVDTGLGLERLVAVLQGKRSNYDTDLFAPLLAGVAALSPHEEIVSYDDIDIADEAERERRRVAMRVVADHVRTIAFAIADGVSPGNAGRSYVIRRILRRAVRFGYQALGMREPFVYRLIAPLVEKMGDSFPELRMHREHIERVTRAEEEHFLRTLGTGIDFFEYIANHVKALTDAIEESEQAVQEAAARDGVSIHTVNSRARADYSGEGYDRVRETKSAAQKVLSLLGSDRKMLDILRKAFGKRPGYEAYRVFIFAATSGRIPGEIVFLLHDTYGFPVDLTQLMAREKGLVVHDEDIARYEELMAKQKARARAGASFRMASDSKEAWQIFESGDDVASGDSLFVGYTSLEATDVRIAAMRVVSLETNGKDEEKSTRPEARAQYELVLDRTPFYGESGGQVGDTGVLDVGGEQIRVLDTKKHQHRIVHCVDRLPDDPSAPVHAAVDADRRRRIEKHHTATHLLHAALREALGEHVQQRGSLVAPDRLRFDFSHYERVAPEILGTVQARINGVIQRDVPARVEFDVPIAEAQARGAIALFGEKYEDRVRVVTFDPALSVELCGGTHVRATGELGVFRFLSEGSVAAGIRRLEAVVGEEALDVIEQERKELAGIREQLGPAQRPALEEVARLVAENKRLRREAERRREQALAGQLEDFLEQGREVEGIRVITGRMEPAPMDMLRSLAETMRERMGESSVAVLGAPDPEGEKVYLAAVVSDDLIRSSVLKAGDLVGQLARIVGGGGGGRPELATAGGRRPEKLDEVLAAVDEAVRAFLEDSGS